MSWEKVTLGDFISTQKGFAFKSGLYTDSGVPIVRVSNFTMDSISNEDLKYYPIESKSDYSTFELHEKDVIIQTVGSWPSNPASVVGKVVKVPFYLEGALLNQNAVKLLPCDNLDKRFLFYRLKTEEFKGHIIGEARGAANQASITLETIKSFCFALPPLEVQQHIANILSAYDDLIENNQKQIKLLEEVAQRLYKEWFVDLHFPGYENTKIVDGVPEGWKKYKFSEQVEIMSGGTPKTDNSSYYGGSIPFYTPKDSDGSFFSFKTAINITEEGLNNCNSRLYPENTIIITARGTVGKTTLLAVPMAMNQSCYALKPKVFDVPYYVFFALNREINALKTMANGGVFNTIIVKTFDSIFIDIPPIDIIKEFENRVAPIMDLIRSKMCQIMSLQEARDRLLPKLMNGELEV